MLAVLEGFLGYSLLDDLLSGMGLAIAYAVALSIPLSAPASRCWCGAARSRPDAFESRLYIAHVFIFPVLIGILIAVHLALVALRHHTAVPRAGPHRGATSSARRCGPAYALRSLALALRRRRRALPARRPRPDQPDLAVGPLRAVRSATNGAQPDWYLGWLIGALRLMPGFDVDDRRLHAGPEPVLGRLALPARRLRLPLSLAVARAARSPATARSHNLLDRPRDNALAHRGRRRVLHLGGQIFLAGSADRIFVQLGVPYDGQIWIYRVGVFVLPVVAFLVARRVLQRAARQRSASFPRRDRSRCRGTPDGGFKEERRRPA